MFYYQLAKGLFISLQSALYQGEVLIYQGLHLYSRAPSNNTYVESGKMFRVKSLGYIISFQNFSAITGETLVIFGYKGAKRLDRKQISNT